MRIARTLDDRAALIHARACITNATTSQAPAAQHVHRLDVMIKRSPNDVESCSEPPGAAYLAAEHRATRIAAAADQRSP